jgi:hypothetical protein
MSSMASTSSTSATAMAYGWSTGGGGERWARAERPTKGTVDAAAIAALRLYLPGSSRANKEWGGSICRNRVGRYTWSDPAESEDAGSVLPSLCASGTREAEYHTHVLTINGVHYAGDGPSGQDLQVQYNNRLPAYLGVNRDYYPPGSDRIDCEPRGEGNIWKYVMDSNVAYSSYHPVYLFRPDVIACAPYK